MTEFDLTALFEALDAKRSELGLSWQEVAQQATDRPSRRSERRISASTFKAIGQRQSVRDTVVLQALRWLGRSPESFVPGGSDAPHRALPDDDSGRPALDTAALYQALDEKRTQQDLRWREVAEQIGGGINVATLQKLSEGTGIGFPRAMRIFAWLDRPVADFVCFIPDEED